MKLVWVVMKSFDVEWPEEVMVLERMSDGKLRITDRNGGIFIVKEVFKSWPELRQNRPELQNPIYFDLNRTMEI